MCGFRKLKATSWTNKCTAGLADLSCSGQMARRINWNSKTVVCRIVGYSFQTTSSPMTTMYNITQIKRKINYQRRTCKDVLIVPLKNKTHVKIMKHPRLPTPKKPFKLKLLNVGGFTLNQDGGQIGFFQGEVFIVRN